MEARSFALSINSGVEINEQDVTTGVENTVEIAGDVGGYDRAETGGDQPQGIGLETDNQRAAVEDSCARHDQLVRLRGEAVIEHFDHQR